MEKYSNDGPKYFTFDYDNDDVHQNENPEYDPDIPHVYVNGTISYFAQACHIFSRTVKENIVFGKAYDEDKYNRVV